MSRNSLRWNANSLLSSGLLALLLITYAGLVYVAVVAIGVLLGGGPEQNLAVPWRLTGVAIVLIVVTLWPVGRWLHRHVNDVVYGLHDDLYAVILPINQQLQAMTNPDLTLPALTETIATVLKVPYVAIETTSTPSPHRYAFGKPPERAEVSELPITYLDEHLGRLLVSGRGPTQSLSANDLTLLRDAVQQMGIALHTTQLTAELQIARERLIIAREEERRRIRNDLHDGLAPTLSAMQLQLGAVQRLIRRDPTQAELIANELREDLRRATAEIRQLVYGLRPPMLDDLGLVAAIRNFRIDEAAIHLDVTSPDPLPQLPAAVEVAVYRIAIEAIHNVVKHAKATECRVDIEVASGYLSLSVTDNGQSSPDEYATGIGVQSMQERAAELGGTFSLHSTEYGGTRVVTRLPLGI